MYVGSSSQRAQPSHSFFSKPYYWATGFMLPSSVFSSQTRQCQEECYKFSRTSYKQHFRDDRFVPLSSGFHSQSTEGSSRVIPDFQNFSNNILGLLDCAPMLSNLLVNTAGSGDIDHVSRFVHVHLIMILRQKSRYLKWPFVYKDPWVLWVISCKSVCLTVWNQFGYTSAIKTWTNLNDC